MSLRFSPAESEVLNLKVARGEDFLEEFDPIALTEDIVSENYDIVRLKINGKNTSLFEQLNTCGFPYQVFTVNYQNIKVIEGKMEIDDPEVTCEAYLGENPEMLKEILEKVIGTRSWPEYTSGLMRELVPESRTKALAVSYFSGFYPEKDANARTWLLRYRDKIVGLFMGRIEAETFYGTLYGILPEYRSLGFSKIIYQYMANLCSDLGLKYFKNDIHILNLRSQSSAVGQQVVPKEIYYNIVLYPLFSKDSGQGLSERLMEYPEGGGLFSKLIDFSKDFNPPGNPYQYRLSQRIQANTQEAITLKLSQPVWGNGIYMVHFKVLNEKRELLYFGYIDFK